MISELNTNGITSGEFINVSNWGIKNNGNLGIFDIGYGDNDHNEFTTQPKEIKLDGSNLVDLIKKNLNISSLKFIGKGEFGDAYDIGGNKVLKITKDKSEAINSMKI